MCFSMIPLTNPRHNLIVDDGTLNHAVTYVAAVSSVMEVTNANASVESGKFT